MSSIRQFIASLTERRPGDLFARVQAAAHDAATSPYNRDQPTAAQLEANSYRTGRVDIQGLPVRIENPRGTRREKPGRWSNLMTHHYGDIAGTNGNDGDPVDVFIGPFPELHVVYVVNQVGRDGAFDEHKVCIGFQSEADARSAYLSAYAPGWYGLGSITRATVSQLKWWLKFGDKSRPFTPEVLPYEGTPTMDKVLWNSQAEPITKPLHAIMYELRVEDADAGLMLDSLSMADLMADPDITAAPVLDAMVAEVGRLQPKMEALKRIMEAAGATVKPTEMNISDPVRYRGVAQVMVIFTMSDGQTVSVWFHNPDTTPAKLMPLDELISWKWMLNKKDVTIVVAPEKGRDLNPREVARRIMRLVERNTEAFKKANARTAERAAELKALDAEIAGLETRLDELGRQIEVAKVQAEERKAVENLDLKGFKKATLPNGTIQLSYRAHDGQRAEFAIRSMGGGKYQVQFGTTTMKSSAALPSVQAAIDWAAQIRSGIFGEKEFNAKYADYLAAVVAALVEKAGISAAEAEKLANKSDRVPNGLSDQMDASETADLILADNKRSPNVERAYAIGEVLMSRYGWSKSDLDEEPEIGLTLESPRDSTRWVHIGEAFGKLSTDSSQGFKFAFDPELSTDAELAQNIDRADFEAELDTGVDGLIGEGNEFEGKTAEFAYAAELLRKGAAAAGAMVQFGDFSGSATPSMFDKATPAMPYAEVSVYGITAQIGIGGKVLARAIIDEAGKITMLKGSGGTEEVGTPDTANEVASIIGLLVASEASAPQPEPVKSIKAPDGASQYLVKLLAEREELVQKLTDAGQAFPDFEQFMADVESGNRLGNSMSGLKAKLAEYTQMQSDVQRGTVTPRRVIGTGGTKKAALAWIANEKAVYQAAVDSGGLFNYINLGNYNSTLKSILRGEGDKGFISNDQKAEEDRIAAENEARRLEKEKADEAKFAASRQYTVGTEDGIRDPLELTFTISNNRKDVVLSMADLQGANEIVTFLMEKAKGDASGVAMKGLEQFSKAADLNRARKDGALFKFVEVAPRAGYTSVRAVIDLNTETGEDPIAIVDAAYKFDDATDDFKRFVADSVNETDYSTFATAKLMDQKVKGYGGAVSWGVEKTLDAIMTELFGADALLDSAGSKKIVVDDQVPMADRPFGAKQVAFVSWGASGGAYLVDVDREARQEFGGGVFLAPAGELPGGPRLVRLDPKGMTMQTARKGDGTPEWEEPVKVKGIKVFNLGKFTAAYRVAATMDAADVLDGVPLSVRAQVVDVPLHRRPFGAKQVAFADWGVSGGVILVEADAEDRKEFGSGVFRTGKGEMATGEHIVRIDPKGMKLYFVDNDHYQATDDVKWQTPVKLKTLAIHDLDKFNKAFGAPVMDSAGMLDAVQWDTVVGTIKSGGKVVGRAHIGGDGKAMIFVGAAGDKRVQYLSKFDGQIRDRLWSDDDAPLMVDDLFTLPVNGVATEEQAPAAEPATTTEPAPAANPDAEFLNGMISGTVHLLDPDLVNKLEPMFEKYADDAAMMDLLNRAANAYADAAVTAAKAALGA